MLFGSEKILPCDGTQDIAPSLLTQLCFKHQNISPRKKSLAWMTSILVGNARPTEMAATATKKRRSHEDVRAPLALRVW